MYKSHLIALFLLFFAAHLIAQNPDKCGLHIVQNKLMAQNPEYERELEAFSHEIAQYAKTTHRSNAVLTIPVVVHVIHSGQSVGAGPNVSNARIMSQIDILNKDYRRQNTDSGNTPSEFSGMAKDTEIEFCLASKNPSGNSTTGIVRREYDDIPDIEYIEDVIKPNTTWNNKKYLNIWVLDIPQSGVLGYSYLPTNNILNTPKDGIVIAYYKFGYVSSQNNGRTTTHEVGHYLGLQHIWGSNESCGNDDNINDTPNCSGPHYGCPNFPQASCTTTDMHMNYMDYVDDHCMNMFTEGQKNAMRGVLSNTRSGIIAHASTACNLVSTDEIDANIDINLFPNPVTDQLTIDMKTSANPSNMTITIIDRIGQKVRREVKTSASGQYHLDFSSFSNGLYILRLEWDDKQSTHKVMKIK